MRTSLFNDSARLSLLAGDDQQECLDAVNAVREVAGLDLPPFTAPQDPKKMKTSSAATYEDALYNLTCEDIKNSAIDPTVSFFLDWQFLGEDSASSLFAEVGQILERPTRTHPK